MKSKRRRRALELVKSLLILLLSCSALYLAMLALLPGGPSALWGRLSASSQTDVGATRPTLLDETLRPAALAVTGENGRATYLYDQELPEGYPQASTLLAEALSAAQAPQRATQSQWQEALSGPSLFLEYLGELPLDDLSRWLAGQENAALAGCYSRRVVVTPQQLFFYSNALVSPLSAQLTVDLTEALRELSVSFSPNGGRFAFEETTGYQRLRPDTPLLAVTPTMPTLLSSRPIVVDQSGQPNEALSQLLQVLSFHPQTNPLYAIPNGWAITDGSDTLRISNDGLVSFRQSGENTPRFPLGEHPLDTARTLVEQALGALCGDGHLYLRSCETTDSETVFTFGYAYRGAAINVGDEGACASLTLKGNAITALTLRPRHYAVQSDAVALLPQLQAAAAVTAQRGWSLGLWYADNTSTRLNAFWAAGRS